MRTVKNYTNFRIVLHPRYRDGELQRLLQESSVIGEYKDALNHPGSSYLWVGQHHHLSREEVQELIERLTYWIENKRLKLDGK